MLFRSVFSVRHSVQRRRKRRRRERDRHTPALLPSTLTLRSTWTFPSLSFFRPDIQGRKFKFKNKKSLLPSLPFCACSPRPICSNSALLTLVRQNRDGKLHVSLVSSGYQILIPGCMPATPIKAIALLSVLSGCQCHCIRRLPFLANDSGSDEMRRDQTNYLPTSKRRAQLDR